MKLQQQKNMKTPLEHYIQHKHIEFAKRNGVNIVLPETRISYHMTTVVLIGWMGSTPRLLRHYVNIYTELGYTVVYYIPSALQFISEYIQRREVGKVLDTLMNMECIKEKKFSLYIHAMSNNGGQFYAKMLSMIHNEAKYKPLLELIDGMCAEAFPGVQDKDIRICNVLSGIDLTAAGGQKRKTKCFNWINPISWLIFFFQIVVWLFYFLRIFMGK